MKLCGSADLHKEDQAGRVGHPSDCRLWWHALITFCPLYGRLCCEPGCICGMTGLTRIPCSPSSEVREDAMKHGWAKQQDQT